MISFGAVLYDFRYCMTFVTVLLGLVLKPGDLYDFVRNPDICIISLLYCLAWCCRWSRELCLSRSCMISFGAVLYDFRYCTAWLGAVGGPESYV